MGCDIRQWYAANAAQYNFASATDPQKDMQLITGLGITVERLNTIKRTFKQVIIKNGILYVLFRRQLNDLLYKQVIQKVIYQVIECEKVLILQVYKAIQNMLACVQLNIYKKIKALGRLVITYIVDAERGYVVAVNL